MWEVETHDWRFSKYKSMFRVLGSQKARQTFTTLTIPYAGEYAEKQEFWGGAVIGTTDMESILVIAPT